ncbi:annulin-like isoform X3 [Rhodnius prolixus]|uniref:annulin-like isoform X3 n=1 Tax=Rhodnius prolixus TaxID=13249 RepID=UPI003D189C24
MLPICPECKSVIAYHDLVKCDGFCKRKFHQKCVSYVKTKWLCSGCYSQQNRDLDVRKNIYTPEGRKRRTNDFASPSMQEEIDVDNGQLDNVVTSTDNISRKLEEISREMGRLSSTMSVLRGENLRLKEDNRTLKLAINQLCIRPCDLDCMSPCAKREELSFVQRGENDERREMPSDDDNCIILESCHFRQRDQIYFSPKSGDTRPQDDMSYFPKTSHIRAHEEISSCTLESCQVREELGTCQKEICCHLPGKKWKSSQTQSTYTHCEPIESDGDNLQIICVDPCLYQNGCSHHTGMFDLMIKDDDPRLVARRGRPFVLELILNRPYNKETDVISFIFTHELDENPSIGHKTLIVLPLNHNYTENKSENIWSANIDKSDGNSITVLINSHVNAIIGKWIMEIHSGAKRQRSCCYRYKYPIYILFNAWCKDDAVYMDGAESRKEYILTEVGSIWKGSLKQPQCSLWKYGQFDNNILDYCLMLLQKNSKLPITQCNDPIMVARAVASAVNNTDNNGIVYGNWSGDYYGGKNPSEWIGSPKILRKFYQTQKPVKYGHSSIIAGIATTVFRALGIPSRPVTCYKTAHDFGCSNTIDIYIDDEGEFTSRQGNKELIWMYHVWCEIWITRADLGARYDGWQIVDGTPVESNYIFRPYGPTPVVAVKNDEISKPYDVAYVCSEINADIVYWKFQGRNKSLKIIQTNSTEIGQAIFTKAIGDYEIVNLTDQYKHQSKKKEETLVMLKALESGNMNSRYSFNENFKDVLFQFNFDSSLDIGKSFRVSLISRNVSEINHTVRISLRCVTQLYSGQLLNIVKKEQRRLAVAAESEEKAELILDYEDYAPHLKDEIIYHLYALCKVENTNYEYFAQDDFRITFPSITIERTAQRNGES